jgi:hypothetical protein
VKETVSSDAIVSRREIPLRVERFLWREPHPQNPYPQYAPPAYRLYNWGAVALATLIGGPLAGTILMAGNFRKLGQGNNSIPTLLLGAAASVGMIYVSLTTTMNPMVVTLVLLVCTSAAAYQL